MVPVLLAIKQIVFALSAFVFDIFVSGSRLYFDIMGNGLLVDNLRLFCNNTYVAYACNGRWRVHLVVLRGMGMVIAVIICIFRTAGMMINVHGCMSVVVFDGGVTGAICGFVVSTAFSSI